jgi:hypothetical protein
MPRENTEMFQPFLFEFATCFGNYPAGTVLLVDARSGHLNRKNSCSINTTLLSCHAPHFFAILIERVLSG